MRILQAVKLVCAEAITLEQLWSIATRPERVQIALILGRPAELPEQAATPDLAWAAMSTSQRRVVLRHAPPSIRRRLPTDPAAGRRTIWMRRTVTVAATG